MKNVDVLVVGSGIAGLEAAMRCAEKNLNVRIISKGAPSSNFVLGFNAPISANDSEKSFFDDTVKGGENINDKNLVKLLVENAEKAVNRYEGYGLNFDKSNGCYDLLKPLGCSHPRLVHSENSTGKKGVLLLGKMLFEKNIFIEHNKMLAELIVDDNKVCGAVVLNLEKEQIEIIRTKAVIIASGGISLESGSTYDTHMTGDGYAIAYRAGAQLSDMEFIQFEPCRSVYPKPLGISTTLLANGGIIYNKNNERFLLKHYASEAEVPKDRLAFYIGKEILEGRGGRHGGVYLDLKNVPPDEIKLKHSLYYIRFKNVGIDLTKEAVEVAPCQHSFMGGIKVNKNTETGVFGLFACGEAICGIHGANRLGGNAGTEIFVFGDICGQNAAKYAEYAEFEGIIDENEVFKKYISKGGKNINTDCFSAKIRKIAKENLSVIRNGENLISAIENIRRIIVEIDKTIPENYQSVIKKEEAKNLTLIAYLSCKAALEREESRGTHYRSDYPSKSEKWEKNITFSKNENL
ncbi:MAG: FAD-binding protein [Clostridia bacterium]|nr:FAD-binding protein [Clostridia bacterium]